MFFDYHTKSRSRPGQISRDLLARKTFMRISLVGIAGLSQPQRTRSRFLDLVQWRRQDLGSRRKHDSAPKGYVLDSNEAPARKSFGTWCGRLTGQGDARFAGFSSEGVPWQLDFVLRSLRCPIQRRVPPSRLRAREPLSLCALLLQAMESGGFIASMPGKPSATTVPLTTDGLVPTPQQLSGVLRTSVAPDERSEQVASRLNDISAQLHALRSGLGRVRGFHDFDGDFVGPNLLEARDHGGPGMTPTQLGAQVDWSRAFAAKGVDLDAPDPPGSSPRDTGHGRKPAAHTPRRGSSRAKKEAGVSMVEVRDRSLQPCDCKREEGRNEGEGTLILHIWKVEFVVVDFHLTTLSMHVCAVLVLSGPPRSRSIDPPWITRSRGIASVGELRRRVSVTAIQSSRFQGRTSKACVG